MEKTFQIFNQDTDDEENKENQDFISLPNISRKLDRTKTIGKVTDSDVEDEENDTTIQVPNDETFTPDQKSTDTTFIPEKNVNNNNPSSDLTFIPVDPILGQEIRRDNNIPEIKLPHPENAQKPMFPSID